VSEKVGWAKESRDQPLIQDSHKKNVGSSMEVEAHRAEKKRDKNQKSSSLQSEMGKKKKNGTQRRAVSSS